ncbi:MAG: TonB-dependent receptor [Prevotella sp.]|nr:TonB-dependent receptor [Prevotella sp.]
MKRLYILLLLCIIANIAQAQKISRSYHEQSLSKVLEDLNAVSTNHDISFVYNDLEDFTVTCSFKNKNIDEALQMVIGLYPVRIERDEEKYFVECTYKTDRHLTGTIVDEHSQPVAFANVAILNPTDSTILSGGVSNEAGQFVVPYEQEKVIVRISYIGYKTVYRLCTSESMGTVRLQPEAYTINNVTIKGIRPQYKLTSGGMNVNVSGTLLANMGSALSVIGELPLISVKDGKIEMLAKGEPEVYINSKKVRDMSELSELKSTDIKSIEIISNPGAQYDATVEAVIRIKTIRRLNEGLSFRSSTMALYNSEWMGEQQAQLTYRQGGLETFALLTYGNYCDKQENHLTYNIVAGQDQVEARQVANMYGRDQIATCKAGFSYDFSDNHSLGLSYQVDKLFNAYWDIDDTESFIKNGVQEPVINASQAQSHVSGPNHSLDAYYAGTFGKLTVNFDGTCFWDKDGVEQDVTEISTGLEVRNVKTESSNRKRLLAGKLVVGYPFVGGQFEFGSEVSHTKIHSLYYSNFEQIPSTDNEVRENHLALFADYSLPLGKTFILNAGLRYEHVANNYDVFGKRDEEASRTYDQLFPNVSISWKKQMWGVELSYNQRVRRPSYNALTRHLQYDSRYLYEGGNLYVQPQFNHNVALNVVYSWFNFRAEYSYQDNRIMQLSTLYNGQPIDYTKWENVSRMEYLSASMVAAPKFGFYQPQYTLMVRKQFFDAAAYGIIHDLQKPMVYVRLQNRFLLGKTSFIGLNLSGYPRYSAETIERKSTVFADLIFYKAFANGRWVLNVDVKDLFYSNRERWVNYGNCVETEKDNWACSRRIIATLTYNFNQKRSKYRGTGAGEDEKSRF